MVRFTLSNMLQNFDHFVHVVFWLKFHLHTPWLNLLPSAFDFNLRLTAQKTFDALHLYQSLCNQLVKLNYVQQAILC